MLQKYWNKYSKHILKISMFSIGRLALMLACKLFLGSMYQILPVLGGYPFYNRSVEASSLKNLKFKISTIG
jgi:hypothetical protein